MKPGPKRRPVRGKLRAWDFEHGFEEAILEAGAQSAAGPLGIRALGSAED